MRMRKSELFVNLKKRTLTTIHRAVFSMDDAQAEREWDDIIARMNELADGIVERREESQRIEREERAEQRKAVKAGDRPMMQGPGGDPELME